MAPVIDYPSTAPPSPEGAISLAPGVLWLRRGLPWATDHINVWALEDGDGWTVVDTGLADAACMAAWESAFGAVLGGRPVTRVICTHLHRDHAGLAGWFTRRFGCRLWMTRLEYLACRLLIADAGRESSPESVAFQRAAGWTEEAIRHHRGYTGRFGESIEPLPDSYRRVHGDEEIRIGAHRWRAVIGRGHSPEHLCLYSPDLALMIAGDQVLPEITTNVSVQAMEPDGDPLADWIESLARIRRDVPDDVLVLPAHGLPFRGLHFRLSALQETHEQGLRRVLDELATPRRAVDLFPLLFRRPVGMGLIALASGESLAHLNCLVGRGLVRRERDAAGVDWYRRA